MSSPYPRQTMPWIPMSAIVSRHMCSGRSGWRRSLVEILWGVYTQFQSTSSSKLSFSHSHICTKILNGLAKLSEACKVDKNAWSFPCKARHSDAVHGQTPRHCAWPVALRLHTIIPPCGAHGQSTPHGAHGAFLSHHAHGRLPSPCARSIPPVVRMANFLGLCKTVLVLRKILHAWHYSAYSNMGQ